MFEYSVSKGSARMDAIEAAAGRAKSSQNLVGGAPGSSPAKVEK
jgi:hypothetical protein